MKPQSPAQSQEYMVHKTPKQSPIHTKEEFLAKVSDACDPFRFERSMHQHVGEHYLSVRSGHRSLLLFQGLGTGKSCAAITIAESLLESLPPRPVIHNLPAALSHYAKAASASVWILAPSALETTFRKQIFDVAKLHNPATLKEQCTGDTYLKLVPTFGKPNAAKRIAAVVNSRYYFFKETELATMVRDLIKSDKDGSQSLLKSVFRDKTFIIDEVHNIRVGDTKDKNIVGPITDMLKASDGSNRLVLLSATPMYDDPEEIMWLFSLMLYNDGEHEEAAALPKLFDKNKKPVKKGFIKLKELAAKYISYVKGKNPFVFPARLSPAINGVHVMDVDDAPKLAMSGEPINEAEGMGTNAHWWTAIKDGIVPTPIGDEQRAAIESIAGKAGKEKVVTKKIVQTAKTEEHMNTLLQLNNVAFPVTGGFEAGQNGINAIFDTDDGPKDGQAREGIQLKYKKGVVQVLKPTGPSPPIERYASKIKRVLDFVKDCDGVCTIYSQFIAGGVVPVAVALEHLGYKRYGSRPMLSISPVPKANGKTYCIMSGQANLMGPNINEMEVAINEGKVDVVLMTNKVSEGFSFKNVREVHVLDPWYNLNRIEQIIGRAIRTCSHVALPLEKRNVTVYLHANVNMGNKARETAELHAYRISAVKAHNIALVERAIQEGAMDCAVQHNLNWIPSSLFGFEITMETAQKHKFEFRFGDSDEAPTCDDGAGKSDAGKLNSDSWRPEVYDHIVPTIQQRLRRLLVPRRPYKLNDILEVIGSRKVPGMEDVALRAIQKAIDDGTDFMMDHQLIAHDGHIILMPVEKPRDFNRIKLSAYKQAPKKAAEQVFSVKSDPKATTATATATETSAHQHPIKETMEPDAAPKHNFESIFKNLSANDTTATIEIYTRLDSEILQELAGLVLRGTTMSPVLTRVVKLLKGESVFVNMKGVNGVNGYVDIFADKEKYVLNVLDGNELREAVDSELELVKASSTIAKIPNTINHAFGFFGVHKHKDRPSNMDFKILFPDKDGPKDASKRKNRGAACMFMKVDALKELLSELGKEPSPAMKTKNPLCAEIPRVLHEKGRLLFPPIYKLTTLSK
jgi:hypothetical protein